VRVRSFLDNLSAVCWPTCGDVRWVYRDARVFTGLVETLDEAPRHRTHRRRRRAAGVGGDYTACYSTMGFNGFDPLPTVVG